MNTEFAIPEAFIRLITQDLGQEEAERLLESLETAPPTSIRLNQKKATDAALLPLQGAQAIAWCPWGYYLPSRPVFTGDPLFHAGHYYVQEASSMLLYQVKQLLDESAPITALDLCAAPGGKSSLLLDMLPEGSTLLSNEVVPQRAHILTENLQKWGNPNSIITSVYPDRLGRLRNQFDLILVDAPCSGEGMFRKDPAARSEWSASSPQVCAERQRSIIDDIWHTLRDGGLFVYSTCTINRAENEDIVAYILDQYEASAVDLGEIGGGVWRSPLSSAPCYRMLPHRVEGEGLFMAVFRKGDLQELYRTNEAKKSKTRLKPKGTPSDIPQEVKGWLSQSDTDWCWERVDEQVVAYPKSQENLLYALRNAKITPLSYGVPVAEIKGKSVIPLAPLALSSQLSREAFDEVEVDLPTAIAYLSKETFTLSSDISHGIKLICYQSVPIGFAKHLGNRTNNLYPTHWRIRHREQIERKLSEQTT